MRLASVAVMAGHCWAIISSVLRRRNEAIDGDPVETQLLLAFFNPTWSLHDFCEENARDGDSAPKRPKDEHISEQVKMDF